MKKLIMISCLFLLTNNWAFAQDDLNAITQTLNDYIEGTANGQPNRLKDAFHEDFNLYFVQEDSLNVWSGKNYISNIKEGRKNNRIGKIISVDVENDAAMAKVEILMPERERVYTDYFLLLKLKDKWQIIHKSFTYKTYDEKE